MANVINYYFLLFLFLSFITLSAFFYLIGRRRRRRRRTTFIKTPSLQSIPLIGNIIGFLLNRHRYHDWLTDMLTTTPSHTLKLNISRTIYTANPTNLERILAHNFPNYIKHTRYTAIMQQLLGTGVFNSNANMWSSQRRMATHYLSYKSLLPFISDTINSQVDKCLIPYLLSAGDVVDLQDVFQRFCFDNICTVAFGAEQCLLTSNANDSTYMSFFQAFDVVVEHTSKQFMSALPKRILDIWNKRKYKEAIKTVNRFAMDVIRSKETQTRYKTNQDLLSSFMVSTLGMGFEEDERKEFLRDPIINFIFAGKDTTSSTLTWFFWLLDGHPHCKHLIHDEISTLITSSKNIHPLNLTLDNLRSLNYLYAAVSESMRLFPPVPMISRSALDDDVLPDGTHVGENWFVECSVYAMGRMERVWGYDCREFKPERWLDGNGVYKRLDRFKYPIFGVGFRTCLGKEMAFFQMMSVVVAVMHEFEVEVIGGGGSPEKMKDPPYTMSSTALRMKNGLHVRLRKRQESNGPRVKDGSVIISLFGMFIVGLSFYKHIQYKFV